MAHTPGPWSAHGGAVYIGKTGTFLDNGEPAWGGFDVRLCPNPEANARLIAASPDLLEALELAESHLAHCMGEDVEPRVTIRAAIAKARGQS